MSVADFCATRLKLGPGVPSALMIPSERRFKTLSPRFGWYVAYTWSNDRFSPTMTRTCLIGERVSPSRRPLSEAPAALLRTVRASGREDGCASVTAFRSPRSRRGATPLDSSGVVGDSLPTWAELQAATLLAIDSASTIHNDVLIRMGCASWALRCRNCSKRGGVESGSRSGGARAHGEPAFRRAARWSSAREPVSGRACVNDVRNRARDGLQRCGASVSVPRKATMASISASSRAGGSPSTRLYGAT